MDWYFPSWNGDFRIEPVVKDPNYREAKPDADADRSMLTIHDPTFHEREQLTAFLKQARKRGWVKSAALAASDGPLVQQISIRASVQDAGELMLKIAAPQVGAITAVRSENGKVRVADTRDSETTSTLVHDKEADKAVTVKRPTMCCPTCIPGSIEPASEVLLSFLDDDQHRTWATRRAIVVQGGITGHRYVVAHRHSDLARRMTKITWDLDTNAVVHCFDWSVPPEEEVLAVKLMLEHREPWIRNEASMFFRDSRLKNPFGGLMDGTDSAAFLTALGDLMDAYGIRSGAP